MALGGSGGGGGSSITISSVQVTNANYTPLSPITSFLNTTGGYISIFGTGFSANNQVYVQGIPAISTTFVSSTQINAQAPALNTTTVTVQQIYVVNTVTNNAGSLITNVGYGVAPTYTGSYNISLTSPIYLGTPVYSDSTMTYNILSGTVPAGYSFNTSTGILYGFSSTTTSTTIVIQEINQQNQSSTQSVTFNLIGSDQYYNYTTLLLTGEIATSTWITDVSTSSIVLSPSGTTYSSRYSPLWGNGYYGNSFDGSSGTISIPNATPLILNIGTAPTFTIEFWAYCTSSSGGNVIDKGSQPGSTVPNYRVSLTPGSGGVNLLWGDGGGSNYSSYSVSGITILQNTWYHIAVVSLSSSLNIYVNGVSYATGTLSSYGDNGKPVFIGSRYNSDQYFPGYVSNLRIVKGTAVYTTNFTPPTSPLTATSGTSLLTCQSSSFIDNSSYNYTLTPSGTVKVIPNHPFNVLPSSVQNYGSGYFDGSTGNINLPYSSIFSLGSTYTIECWVNIPSYATNGYDILWISNANGASFGYWSFSIGSAGAIGIGCRPYGGGTNAGVTGGTVYTNVWTHIAASVNAGNGTFYINGQLVASGSIQTLDGSQSYVSIGAVNNGYTPASYFTGYLSNLRLTKGIALYSSNFTIPATPLSATTGTQLLTLQNKLSYNNNTFYDDSTNNFVINRTGSVTQGLFSPFSQTGWSNYFNGSSGLTIAATAVTTIGTNNFTYEFWLYIIPGATTYSGYGRSGIFTTNEASNTGFPGLSLSGSTIGSTGFSLYAGTLTYSNAIPQGVWNHFAVVRNSTTLTGYLNGTSVISTSSFSVNVASVPINIGWFSATLGSYDDFFTGYISNLRFVNGTALYTNNFAPSTSPLTVITNTAFLTCQSNRFIDSSNALALTVTGSPQVQAFSPFPTTSTYSLVNNSGSLYFNGSTDYLAVQNSANTIPFSFGTGDFTIEFWMYLTSAAGNYETMFAMSHSAGSVIVRFGNSASYNSLLQVATVASAASNVYSTSIPQSVLLNQWAHIVYTRTAATGRVFVNGTQQVLATGTNPVSFTVNSYSDTTNITSPSIPYIGGDGGTTWFSGYISNIRVIKGLSLYTTGFNAPIAPLNPINTYLSYNSGNSFLFDGSTGYLTVSPASFSIGAGDFSVEAWVYITSAAGSQRRIWSYQASGSSTVWNLYQATGGQFAIELRTSGGVSDNTLTGSTVATTNKWYHVAATRASTTMNLFVNGILDAYVLAQTQSLGSGVAEIGGSSANSNYFPGYISNLRVSTSTAFYTSASNFIPSTTPLTAITGTTLLTLQNSTLIDNSGNNLTITSSGAVTTSTASPFGVITTISNTVTVALALLGTNAGIIDQTGVNNLITYGTVQTVSSSTVVKYGNSSLFFNGPGNYLTVGGTSAGQWQNLFGVGSGPWTVECWVYITNISLSGGNFIFGDNDSSTNNGTYVLVINNSGNVALFQYTSSSNGTTYATSTTMPANTWTHVSWNKSGTTAYLSINGNVQTFAVSSTAYYTTPQNQPYVGSQGAYTSRGFQGYIDDLRITKGIARYTSTFTPAISQLPTVGGLTNTNILVSALILGGGGGGGAAGGGGGGGGGGLIVTQYLLARGSTYTVTVGAGGTAGQFPTPGGTNGNSSTFYISTASGGGAGGNYAGVGVPATGMNGSNGGSGGGGGSYGTQGNGTGGSGITGQGTSGGAGSGTVNTGGGGGGGSNSAGGNGTSSVGGNGGIGTVSYITGSAVVYGDGGGGGSRTTPAAIGGSGNGGLGGTSAANPTPGATNLGGGGGGTGTGGTQGTTSPYPGSNGGSGVVIISYPTSYGLLSTISNLTYILSRVSNNYVYSFTGGSGYIGF
jgi:hypothetical protein